MPTNLRNPILFQGDLKKSNYFEGWYYKQVSQDQRTSLSFIPGISLNKSDEHSFIQYILVETDEAGQASTVTGYIRYPLASFIYQNNPFEVRIGNSVFKEDRVEIDLKDEQIEINGQLSLGSLLPIEHSLLMPNIMGIFAYTPKMECYHGVISMDHSLKGQLTINHTPVQFDEGKGYIEKDWGTSFPKRYIWLQSNHFENSETSLFFSIAHIPFHFTEFEGFICNLVHQGKEYRFATYNLSRCSIEDVSSQQVRLRLDNRKAKLEIVAEVSDRAVLIAPVKGIMQKTIKEGMSGVLRIRLEDKQTDEVFEGFGRNAGVEIVDYSV